MGITTISRETSDGWVLMMPISFTLKGITSSNKDVLFKVPSNKLDCDRQADFGEPGWHGQSRTTSQVEWSGKSEQG